MFSGFVFYVRFHFACYLCTLWVKPQFVPFLPNIPHGILHLSRHCHTCRGYTLVFSLDGFGIFRFRQLVARWSGDELFYHSIRLSVDYQSKLRETEGMLDFFQASPTTIAILQDNKIQLYDLETHQFLKQKTIQGMFNKSLLLKQSASFSTLDVVGNEVEECDFLVIYTKNDTELQFKICSLEAGKIIGPPINYPIAPKSHVLLRAVLMVYEDDAYLPYELNTRVKIEHTSNPMQLIIQTPPNSGQSEFYRSLHSSPKIWSTIEQISNLNKLVQNHDKTEEIVFELAKEKTLVHEPEYFDHFYQAGDGSKKKQDDQLRLKKGKRTCPSMDTAIFLEGFHVDAPMTVFENTFSHKFPQLMRTLWVGNKNNEIQQLRGEFNIEDDLPAMSFIHNKLDDFASCKPKQNSDMWENWQDYLPSDELVNVLKKIEEKVQWPRRAHAHQMMHGDLTPANVVVNTGVDLHDGEYSYDLFLCDFPDVVNKRRE